MSEDFLKPLWAFNKLFPACVALYLFEIMNVAFFCKMWFVSINIYHLLRRLSLTLCQIKSSEKLEPNHFIWLGFLKYIASPLQKPTQNKQYIDCSNNAMSGLIYTIILSMGQIIDKRSYKIRLVCIIRVDYCLFCIGFCSEFSICKKDVPEKKKFLAAC